MKKYYDVFMLQIMIAILKVHHDPISNKFCGSSNRLRPSAIGFSYSSMLYCHSFFKFQYLSKIMCKEGFQLLFHFYRFSLVEFTSQSRLQSLCSYCSHFKLILIRNISSNIHTMIQDLH